MKNTIRNERAVCSQYNRYVWWYYDRLAIGLHDPIDGRIGPAGKRDVHRLAGRPPLAAQGQEGRRAMVVDNSALAHPVESGWRWPVVPFYI
jgi:hypothetical protein